MKKTLMTIALAVSALVGFTACEKERNDTSVVEGLPVNSVTIKMNTPSDDKIAVTRASAEVETTVQNMALLFYKAGANDRPVIVYVDKNGMGNPTKITGGSSSESTNYLYTVNLDVEGMGITTGDWYLYAIGNYNTKFCNIEMSEIAELSRTEFLDYKINKTNRELDIVENSVLMTGNYCEDGDFGGDGSLTLEYADKDKESCVINGVIHLRRVVAKISFEFKNGSNGETTGVTFTPETYSIHEYSRSASLMERNTGWTTTGGVDNEAGYFGTGDFHSHEEGTSLAVVGNKFEFYMPENIQSAKGSPEKWTYAERERRVSSDDRTFKYAPDHGTYVVVKGQYKDSKYSGDVTYTIHLGDFSTKNGSAYDNFSIRRNYHYTYTITVNGVNSIAVEAETNAENQSGAEGNLTGLGDETVNIRLDAHYENVLLKIKAPAATSTINEYAVMLNTPYCKNMLVTSGDLTNKAAADYDWIRFGKPAGETTFKVYKESETTDIFSLLDELKGKSITADGEHYLVRDGYIYTTAYVNEYYYDGKMNTASDRSAELKKFINAEDRTMRVTFGSIKVSEDKHSTLTDNTGFAIQQRSIKTFYNLEVDNPFGIESVEETDISSMEWASESDNSSPTGTDNLNGWFNIPSSIYAGGTGWSAVVDIPNNGYTSENREKINGLIDADNVEHQCFSRNRDEDGDGIIDAEEIKWYLPSVDQCKIYWYGMNSLVEEARIEMSVDTPSTNNYWTSTKKSAIWWADEGSAYGAYNYGYYQNQMIPKIRCVRSLKNISGTISDVSGIKDEAITITGLDSKSVRESGTVSGEYSEHFRGESVDVLPEAFKVAAKDLSYQTSTGGTKSSFTNAELQTGNFCQEHYAEETDKSDLGSWRIPNEKELSLMLKYSENLQTPLSDYTAARSKYARSETVRMVYYVQTGRFITTDNGTTSGFKIRCVRDTTPDTSGSTPADKGSNTYENGGNVIR